MKYIILDTNVLHNDWNLTGTRLTLLTSTAKRLNHCICIPMVVVDELENQYQQALQEKVNEYNKALKSLSHMGTSLTYQKLDIQKQIDGYKDWLLIELSSKGVVILDYPTTGHDYLVAKELGLKKPFLNSQKGYRDALIWETVKTFRLQKKDAEVVFVSENTNDFANKNKESLHDDLAQELIKDGLSGNSVQYVSKIDDYLNTVIKTASCKVDAVLLELNSSGCYGDIDFNQVIKDHVTDTEYSAYLEADSEYDRFSFCPKEYESPTICNIDLEKIEFIDVWKLSEEKSLVTCKATVAIDIDFFIYHGDFAIFDDTYPYVINHNWNNHYAWAEDHATFEVVYNIVVDKDFENIESEEGRVIKASYNSGIEINRK